MFETKKIQKLKTSLKTNKKNLEIDAYFEAFKLHRFAQNDPFFLFKMFLFIWKLS